MYFFARSFKSIDPLNIESAEVAVIINEPIEPARAQGADVLALMARERIFRSFASAGAIATACAENWPGNETAAVIE